MRRLLSITSAACAATALLAPAAGAAAAPRFRIEHNTGAIFQYDPSPAGTGPLYDTVTVNAQLRGCPAGNYVLWMTLVQDGVSYDLASTALGVGEFSCTATATAPQLGMAFYGNGLHPGRAVATATVYRQVDGMPVVAQDSRTVLIPAGYNQP